MKFAEFTAEIQKKIKEVLKVFNECHVIYEYGRYDISPNMVIKKEYAEDHVFIGTYKKEEVFTKNEMLINYVESFHDFPVEYKGNRDYSILKNIDWNTKFKLDKIGNIIKE